MWLLAFCGMPAHIELLIIIGMLLLIGSPVLIWIIVNRKNQPPPPIRCENCGNPSPADAPQCLYCGRPFKPN